MKIFIITIFIFCTAGNEQPPEFCQDNIPFRLSDHSCNSFNEICVKNGDVQCNQLLNACKQCPPSNFTMTILRDIWNMSKLNLVQSNLTKGRMEDKIIKIIEKLSSIQKFMADNLNGYTIPILLGTIIIILIIHLVEIRFKLITRFFQLCVKSGMKYSLLQSRKRKHQNDILDKIKIELEAKVNQSNENLNEIFGLKFHEIIDLVKKVEDLYQKLSDKIDRLQTTSKDHMQHLQNQQLDTLNRTIKFPLEGIEHKYVELYVHNNHNIVQVKERLCTSLRNAKHDDYKRMTLTCNGKILNDNDYLLKQINPSTNSVNYKIDEKIKTSEIIVVKLKGKMCLPEIIQIHKTESIEKFLITIANLINTREFHVYKLCIESNEMIELVSDTNNKTVNDFHLTDGDFLNVVTIERGELKLRSIFNGNFLPTVNYNNTDRISTFLNENKMTNFILFYPKEKMDEKKFIFQFDISNDSQIQFCDFKRFQDINKDVPIYTSMKCEIYFATNKENKKILIKKYNIGKLENWKNDEWMLNELKTFLITKSNPMFIQLNVVYVDDTSFYVSMENMTGGTLSYYLRKNKSFDSNQIIKWAVQILEGLHFLHQHGIIHRNLNPLSILVGENNNLKLSNFNLSKYKTSDQPSSIIERMDQLCYIKLRYMAPEILGSSREYGFQCDVWSFGAVLVRIVSDKKPYPRLSKVEAQNEIIKSGKIEYEFPADKFDNRIKLIIDSCFDKDPESRCEIKDLVEEEMIKKSL